MSCKVLINGKASPHIDDVFDYVMRVPQNNRNPQIVFELLKKAKLISSTRNGYVISMGADVYNNILNLENINKASSRHFGGAILNLRKSEQTRVYNSRFNGGSNLSIPVSINEGIFQSLPQEPFDAEYGVPDNVKDMVAEYHSNQTEEDRLSEQIRAENTSEYQLDSQGEDVDFAQTRKVITKLKSNFAKSGINVEVGFDVSLDVLAKMTYTQKGPKIAINPRLMKEDTAFHEFAHIYVDILGLNHPIVQEILAEVEGTSMANKIRARYTNRADEMGLNLSEADLERKLQKELVATVIGLEGGKITSKDPTKLQELINKLLRAVGKMLGFSTSAASNLAQQMWEATMPKSEYVEFESFAQESLSEEKLMEVVDNTKILLKSFIVQEQKQDKNKKSIRALEDQMARLENVDTVEQFFEFVNYTRKLVVRAKKEFLSLRELVNSDSLTVAQAKTGLKSLYNVHRYLQALASAKTSSGVIADIYKLVSDSVAEQDKLVKGGVSAATPIKYMETALAASMGELVLLEKEYLDQGADIYAIILETMAPSTATHAIDNIISNMRKHKRLVGQPEKNEEYKEILKKYAAEDITGEERDTDIRELYIKQLERKKPTRSAIARMLRSEYKDSTTASSLFDPIIFSSHQAIQLHALSLKQGIEEAAESTRETQGEVWQAYQAFKKATRRSDTNTETFNKELLEVVTHYIYNRDLKKYEPKEILSLVQETDMNKYNLLEREFGDTLKKKYYTPIKERVNALLDKGMSLSRANADPRVKELRLKAQLEKSQWSKKYTDPIDGAEVLYQEALRDVNTKKSLLKSLALTDPMYDVKERNLKIDINLAKRRADGMKYKGVFQGNLVRPKLSEFSNPKYLEMRNLSAHSEYYDSMLQIYKEKQDQATHRLPVNGWEEFSYAMPSVYKTASDRFLSGRGKESVQSWFEDKTQIHDLDHDFSKLTDLNGEPLRIVPTFFSDPAEAGKVSHDIATSILMYSHQSNLYKAKGDLIAEVMIMQDLLDDKGSLNTDTTGAPVVQKIAQKLGINRAQKGTTNNRATQLKEFVDAYVFGEKTLRTEFDALGKTFSMNKLAGGLASFTALNLLSVNLKQAFNQLVLDNSRLMEEGIAGEFLTVKGIAYGKKIYAQEMLSGRLLKDVMALNPSSKVSQFLQYLNALQEFEALGGHGKAGSLVRKAMNEGTGVLMGAQSAADLETTITRTLAIAHGLKFEDKDGTVMNLYEAFQKEDNSVTFKLKKGLKHVVTQADGSIVEKEFQPQHVRNVLSGLYKRTNQLKGDFNNPIAKRRWWGPLVLLFRGWMSPTIRRKFGHGSGLHLDMELGSMTQGMYVSTLAYVKDSVQSGLSFAKQWGMLTSMEKQAVTRTAVEAATMALAYATYMVAMGFADDDKKNKQKWLFVAYQARRLQIELAAFHPLTGNFGADTLRLIKSPTATIRSLSQTLGLIDLMLYEGGYMFGMNYEKEIFYQRRSGDNQKGDRKIYGRLKKLTPVLRGLETSTEYEQSIKWFDKDLY
jgi:hypothetical protein